MTELSLTLNERETLALQALAEARGKSPQALAGEAISAFIQCESDFMSAVDDGLMSLLHDPAHSQAEILALSRLRQELRETFGAAP